MSGFLGQVQSIGSALNALVGGGNVTLGSVVFSGFEVPEKIPFGGESKLVVHQLPGGIRTIDNMGDVPIAPKWSGVFLGSGAQLRAQTVNMMRLSGAPVMLSYGPISVNVVIRKFTADYAQSGYRIPYQIECECLPPLQTATAVGGGALASIIGQSAASAIGSVTGAISQAAGVVMSAVSQVSAVAARFTPLLGIAGINLSAVTNSLTAGSALISGVSNIAQAPASAASAVASLQSAASGLQGTLSAAGASIASITGNATAATAANVSTGQIATAPAATMMGTPPPAPSAAAPIPDPVASPTDMANGSAVAGLQAYAAQALSQTQVAIHAIPTTASPSAAS